MMVRKIATTLVALILFTGAAPAVSPVAGTFALQDVHAKTASYMLALRTGPDTLDRHLDIWMTVPGSSAAIRSYDIDMTQYLHLIVVSDDFRTFLHLHPVLRPDGHFILDVRFPAPALYHIYADATPHGIGQQVFRFDLDLGTARSHVVPDLRPTGTTVTAGPYAVRVSANAVAAGAETKLAVHILEGGRPAKNLHPYLGALAHVVFLNANDLSYVHVHPMPLGSGDDMRMSAMIGTPTGESSPDMALHVKLREPGTYKAWIQFRGGKQLYVAPFVFSVY